MTTPKARWRIKPCCVVDDAWIDLAEELAADAGVSVLDAVRAGCPLICPETRALLTLRPRCWRRSAA